MPVRNDSPIAVGTYDAAWGLVGSASKILAVASDDGDSSHIWAISGGIQNVQTFTFPLLAGVTDPINSAVLTSRVRGGNEGYQTRYFYHWWNSAQLANNWGTYPVAATFPAWNTITDTIATPTLAAVNGEHGFMQAGSGGPDHKWECWVGQFYRTVDFSYAAGSGDAGEFAYLVGTLVGALIGPALMMREMEAISALMRHGHGIWLRPDEFEPAWRAWTGQKRMVLVG